MIEYLENENVTCGKIIRHEARLLADNINEEMSKLFPVSWKALVHDNKESGNGC